MILRIVSQRTNFWFPYARITIQQHNNLIINRKKLHSLESHKFFAKTQNDSSADFHCLLHVHRHEARPLHFELLVMVDILLSIQFDTCYTLKEKRHLLTINAISWFNFFYFLNPHITTTHDKSLPFQRSFNWEAFYIGKSYNCISLTSDFQTWKMCKSILLRRPYLY